MILIPDAPALLLNLPIVITLIATTRYIIGFKTWKNYPVIALALSYFLFYGLLNSHLIALLLWLIFSVSIIGSSVFVRYFARKLKVNYYARMAIIYLGATITALIVIAIIGKTSVGVLVQDANFTLAVFLIGTTIDELAALQFKKDSQEFLRRSVTTLIISYIAGFICTWAWWNSVLVHHQEILLLTLGLDIVLAFWTSLRLTEIIRFNSIIRNSK